MVNIFSEEVIGLDRITNDLKNAARKLSDRESRYLVDYYYQMQDYRIRAAAQEREARKADEPGEWTKYMFSNLKSIENQLKSALDLYGDQHESSVWAKEITGIGPVISAGLKAHIDMEKPTSVSSLHRFAGLDPTVEWTKGKKRPHNAQLKVIADKIGESIIKVQNKEEPSKGSEVPGTFYGRFFVERKEMEHARNAAGDLADQAEDALKKKSYGKDTIAYKHYSKGKLPDAHIHSRARRWVSKLFLSHYYHVAYEIYHEKPHPRPWVIEHGGHKDFIAPPNWSPNW